MVIGSPPPPPHSLKCSEISNHSSRRYAEEAECPLEHASAQSIKPCYRLVNLFKYMNSFITYHCHYIMTILVFQHIGNHCKHCSASTDHTIRHWDISKFQSLSFTLNVAVKVELTLNCRMSRFIHSSKIGHHYTFVVGTSTSGSPLRHTRALLNAAYGSSTRGIFQPATSCYLHVHRAVKITQQKSHRTHSAPQIAAASLVKDPGVPTMKSGKVLARNSCWTCKS